MRASEKFGGLPVTKSIINAFSTNGVSCVTLPATTSANIKTALSGALSAGVLATALNISGAGYLDIFYLVSYDSTSRTHRIKITLDGAVVFDTTSAAVAASYVGILAVGQEVLIGANRDVIAFPQRFKTSCLVEIASSLSETDKSMACYAYRTTT